MDCIQVLSFHNFDKAKNYFFFLFHHKHFLNHWSYPLKEDPVWRTPHVQGTRLGDFFAKALIPRTQSINALNKKKMHENKTSTFLIQMRNMHFVLKTEENSCSIHCSQTLTYIFKKQHSALHIYSTVLSSMEELL